MIVPDDLKIEGERIYLRPITINDATEEYVRWLNDEEVNQYLESRFTEHTLDGLKAYIKKFSADPNYLFLAIIRKDNNRHIGNIKFGPIDWRHKTSDQGIMIGDRDSWGKGYATEAFKLAADYAFQSLKLHKMTAGIYAGNLGSIKAMIKAGYHEEGRKKNQCLYQGNYEDCVLMAKFSEENNVK